MLLLVVEFANNTNDHNPAGITGEVISKDGVIYSAISILLVESKVEVYIVLYDVFGAYNSSPLFTESGG